MKKTIPFLLCLISSLGFSQITIDDSLSAQQLVEDHILSNSNNMTSVSNFSKSSGNDFGEGNGIAAFFANDSGFPIEGVLLSSGFASNAPGPNLSLLNDGTSGWPGDVDLENFTGINQTVNASSLEFDITSSGNQLAINFILASEEYNQNFECSFSDAVAFILTNNETGISENLAKLPSSDILIKTTSIHPEVPGQCDAINESYFDTYNFEPFSVAADAPINFNGQMRRLSIFSALEPNVSYHLKLVVADAIDSSFDVGLFISHFSTNLAINLDDNYDFCEGETLVLDAEIGLPGYTYQWFKDNVILPEEIFPAISISEPGLYKVEALSQTMFITKATIVSMLPPPSPITPTPLKTCDDDNDGFAEFNLHDKDAEIIEGEPNIFISYHQTQEHAEQDILELSSPYANELAFLQTVYARAESDETGCFAVVPLDLIVQETPFTSQIPNDLELADTDNDGFEIFDLTSVEPEIYGSQDLWFDITYHTSLNDALNLVNSIVNVDAYTSSGETIYARLTDPSEGCFSIVDFDLILVDFEDLDNDKDGVPNGEEDLNNNGNYDDDDTDEDEIPNYLDEDDDGDSVDTIIEIAGIGGGFSIDFIDTDEDLIENYLDDDDDGDDVLTIDEDYNNNGTPLDDDINENNIPDFLDSEVALSVESNVFSELSIVPNPASEMIAVHASFLSSEVFIQIMNVQGQIITSETLIPQDGKVMLDVSTYDTGVYFLRLSSEGSEGIQKLIKQ